MPMLVKQQNKTDVLRLSSENRRKCNLVMVYNRQNTPRSDFEQIAQSIRSFAPEINTCIIRDKKRFLWHNLHLMHRPTMVYAPIQLSRFFSVRGAVFQGQPLSKGEELRRLQQKGITVPRWALVTPDHIPDLSDFGPYVVYKPDHAGKGADVKILRKGRVKWRKPKTQYARYKQLEQNNWNWVIQDFVYTGKWPVSFRVETLFGRALWSFRVEGDNGRRPLPGKYEFKTGGISIVASGKGAHFELNADPEIISLAERAHQAFPEIPLLGVDILKEIPSGKLYVIEVNAIGYTWTVSSKPGRKMQLETGIDLGSQFNYIEKAARILAEKAAQCAR